MTRTHKRLKLVPSPKPAPVSKAQARRIIVAIRKHDRKVVS